MKKIFLTGGSGYLGKQIIKKLAKLKFEGEIYCLLRNPDKVILPNNRFVAVKGELGKISDYEEYLKKSDLILHCAAITGKSKKNDYERVNVEYTKLLLNKAKEFKVNSFIFISSIAVSFKDKERYFYAQSKEKAEEAVKELSPSYLIVRPTMLLGKKSPIFSSLLTFASLPVCPVFGDGKNLVQPLYVGDLAGYVADEAVGCFEGSRVVELGGPEKIEMNLLLEKISLLSSSKKKASAMLHLPISFIMFFLRILEPIFYSFMPVTIGQLSSFRNDVIAQGNIGEEKFLNVDRMIESSMNYLEARRMKERLKKEADVFSLYLSGKIANDYIREKYLSYNLKLIAKSQSTFDRILISIARKNRFFTKFCDLYARFFRPQTLLRHKLAGMVSILECTPPYHTILVDSKKKISFISFCFSMCLRGIIMGFNMFGSLLLLLPLQIVKGKSDIKDLECGKWINQR